jgi:hypothetical protein
MVMTVAVAPPTDRHPPLGVEAAPASAWLLPGAWRERRAAGRHRPAARRQTRFRQVIAGIVLTVRTMTTSARKHGWSLAWPAAFTGAGFTVNVTVGLVVLGFACLLMDLRTDSAVAPGGEGGRTGG